MQSMARGAAERLLEALSHPLQTVCLISVVRLPSIEEGERDLQVPAAPPRLAGVLQVLHQAAQIEFRQRGEEDVIPFVELHLAEELVAGAREVVQTSSTVSVDPSLTP